MSRLAVAMIALVFLSAGTILGVTLENHIWEQKTTLLQSKKTPYPIYPLNRLAICMEDRTIAKITVNAPFKQHDCVWVNKDGIVCDSCKDAMMYMILDTVPPLSKDIIRY